MFTHQHRTANGLHMFLGANLRPRDPNEDKFHLKLVLPGAAQADLTKEVSLANTNGFDYRIPITDQGQLGSCAAFSAREAAQTARRFTGQQDQDLHAGWLYERVREVEKSFPADAGSYPADNLDLAITGIPKLSLSQYVQQAGYQYPASMNADAPQQAYVASHHPFYPGDGPAGVFLNEIWSAIDGNMPVILSMYWTNAFFSPNRGTIVAGQTPAQQVGGHAIMVWAVTPGYVLCANHWTTGWSADAENFGHKMRAGDFAIPFSYFQDPSANSMIFEARAVSGVPLAPNPQPDPQPTSTCKDSALGVINPVVQQMQAAYDAQKLSRTKLYRLQGAKAIQSAVQAATL